MLNLDKMFLTALHWYLGEYCYNMLGLNSPLQAQNRHIVIKVAQKLLMLEYHTIINRTWKSPNILLIYSII